jgi:hypothetical protein
MKARETVERETPTAFATSLMVGADVGMVESIYGFYMMK